MKLHWAIGVAVSLFLGWVAFMAADNLPPYEYDVANSYVVPSTAHDGDQIRVMWKLKNVNRVCLGINQRVLFDPKTRVILATYDPAPAAISESIKAGYLNRTFMLPRGLPSGDIGYRANICYECNPFQKFIRPLCIATPELIFHITP